MAPKELAPYFGTPEKPECHLLYNSSTMCTQWSALASGDIRQLKKVCAELQAQEVKKKIARMQTKGATIETDQINRALEFLALVGDAAESLSVEQMAQAVQGAASQAAIAADAQETYNQGIVSPQTDETE